MSTLSRTSSAAGSKFDRDSSRPSELQESKIFPFDVAQLSQAPPESLNENRLRGGGLKDSYSINPSSLLRLGRGTNRKEQRA
jgi:hypothetical protein